MSAPTALIWSDRFRLHDTGAHPENARRLDAIWQRLHADGLLDDRLVVEPEPAEVEDLLLVHEPAYIQLVEAIAESGGGYLDADTLIVPRSYEVALLAVGAAITAVDLVLDGTARHAFAFPRPPGHHAEPGRGMGFCLFNNVAIAARHAIDHRGLSRVAIVDWDVHHGNGTQAAFQESDDVLFVSLHQSPLYPGTGHADERGVRHGFGYTLNLPLRPDQGDAAYLQAFDEAVWPALVAYRPELILVSAGFDAHAADPLANMAVTDEGFAEMARRVVEWAGRLCDGRLVAVLEGGYNLDALATGVELTIQAMDQDKQPKETER